MNLDEFKKFKEEILELLNTNEKHWGLKVQMERLISHVESELRTSVAHGKSIEMHESMLRGNPDRPGLDRRMDAVESITRDIKKYATAVICGILVLIGNMIWDKVIKPQNTIQKP